MKTRTVLLIASGALVAMVLVTLTGCAPTPIPIITPSMVPMPSPTLDAADQHFVELMEGGGFGYVVENEQALPGYIEVADSACSLLVTGATMEGVMSNTAAAATDETADVFINVVAAGVVAYCPEYVPALNDWINQ